VRRSHSPRPERESRTARALGWLLATVGGACLVLTVAAVALGTRPLVVKTASMAPDLPVGTVALVRSRPASEARLGEIVSIVRPDGRRILHRVVAHRDAQGDRVTIVLRGDRNKASDPPVTVAQVERPLLVVPFAGTSVTWLGGRWVQYWLGVLTGVLALWWLARRLPARERVERA
jgi:signal peptidase